MPDSGPPGWMRLHGADRRGCRRRRPRCSVAQPCVPNGSSKQPTRCDVAGEREHLRAGVALGAGFAPLVDAVAHDQAARVVGLDVVDVGGLRRRRRHAAGNGGLILRHAAAVFDRGDQAGLLAADVGAGAAHDLDVEGSSPCRGRSCRATPFSYACSTAVFIALEGQRVLVADVDVAVRRRRWPSRRSSCPRSGGAGRSP